MKKIATLTVVGILSVFGVSEALDVNGYLACGGYNRGAPRGYYGNPNDQQAFNMGWNNNRPDPNMRNSPRPLMDNDEKSLMDNDQPSLMDNDESSSPQDHQIAQKIQNSFRSNRNEEPREIYFNVNNGNVTIRGRVISDQARNDVESQVKNIQGVQNVINQIRVARSGPMAPPNAGPAGQMQQSAQDFAASPQDKELNDKIREKLRQSLQAGPNTALILRTNNGIVMITGRVDKAADARMIRDLIKGVDGVRAVNLQIDEAE